METSPEDRATMGSQVRVEDSSEAATLTDEEIKLRFDYVARDIGKLESAVTALTATVTTLTTTIQGLKLNGRQWPSLITMLIVILPLYGLVIDIIARGKL